MQQSRAEQKRSKGTLQSCSGSPGRTINGEYWARAEYVVQIL